VTDPSPHLDPKPPDKPPEPENKPTAFPLPPEVMDKIPPKQRQSIESFMSAAMSFGPVPNPLASKVTSEHISEFIKLHSRGLELDHDDSKDSRKHTSRIVLTTICLSTVIILALAISGKTDILLELIKAGIFVSGGFGGGYGYSEWRRRKDD